MTNAKAKTIRLLLEDGTLKGVMCIEDSSWNAGELYSAPRESINELMSSEACKKAGVYLLLSEDMVYVGQSIDLSTRIKQHLTRKEWWERAIVLTTKDDSLDRADIDYLEAVLIQKATDNNKLDCNNKTKGNLHKTTKFRKVELEQYLEEAYLLMELIGINVFCEDTKSKKKSKITIPQTYDVVNTMGKSDVKNFLSDNGIVIEREFNYAKMQKKRMEYWYWLNPKTSVVNEEWDIVLNNQYAREITYLHIPANTFSMNKGKESGFFARKDKPLVIDLNILADTLCDRRSGYNFSDYIIKKIKY